MISGQRWAPTWIPLGAHPKKDVNSQLNFGLDTPEPHKMAAAANPCRDTEALHSIADPPTPSLPSSTNVSNTQ